jgi:hypothetical protein
MTRTRRVRHRRLPRPSQLRKTRTVLPALSPETPLLGPTLVTLRTRPTERTAQPDRTVVTLRMPRPERTTHMGRTRDGQAAQRLELVPRTEAMLPQMRRMVATPMPPRQLPEQMAVGQRRQQIAVAHRQQLARSPAAQEPKYRRAIEVGTFVLFKPTT